MKKSILLFALPSLLLAHSGHPGPEAHGDFTHFALGVAIALPLLFGIGILMVSRKKAAQSSSTSKNPS